MFKLNYPSVLLLLIFPLCSIAQDIPFSFPKGVPEDLKFGMSLTDFKQVVDMKTMQVDDTRSWRKVYYQPHEDSEIKSLIYYFAKDVEGQPVYEVIVTYSNRELAQKKASLQFGIPNYTSEDSEEPDEWRFAETNEDVAKWVWVYKDQIVMVGKVPGSEWDEEWNDNEP